MFKKLTFFKLIDSRRDLVFTNIARKKNFLLTISSCKHVISDWARQGMQMLRERGGLGGVNRGEGGVRLV